LKHNLSLGFFKIFMCHCSKSPDESLEQGRNTSRQLTRFNDKSLYCDLDHVYVFLCMVLLVVRMVADVTETRM